MPLDKGSDDAKKVRKLLRQRIDSRYPNDPETTAEDTSELYHAKRCRDGISEKHKNNLIYEIAPFILSLKRQGVDDLLDAESRNVLRFASEQGEKNKNTTLSTRMRTIRVFCEWGEAQDMVAEDLSESVDKAIPETDEDDWVRESGITPDRILSLLAELSDDTETYVSRPHVVSTLAFRVGLRLGAMRALCLRDWNPDELQLQVKHRPEMGCPLKNKKKSTRIVNISAETGAILQDWIYTRRPECEPDEHDGEKYQPLISSIYGRVAKSTMRRDVYAVTCCGGCETDDGRPLPVVQDAIDCPESVPPHSLRKAGASWMLDAGTDKQLVADRIDNSPEVLEKWYNEMTAKQEADVRRGGIKTISD